MVNFLRCSTIQYIHFRNTVFFYKVITTGIPNYLKSKIKFLRSERNPQVLEARITCSIYARSFLIRIARIWNNLPIELRSFNSSYNVFKNRLLTYFNNI